MEPKLRIIRKKKSEAENAHLDPLMRALKALHSVGAPESMTAEELERQRRSQEVLGKLTAPMAGMASKKSSKGLSSIRFIRPSREGMGLKKSPKKSSLPKKLSRMDGRRLKSFWVYPSFSAQAWQRWCSSVLPLMLLRYTKLTSFFPQFSHFIMHSSINCI